jgi:hypothetical protein
MKIQGNSWSPLNMKSGRWFSRFEINKGVRVKEVMGQRQGLVRATIETGMRKCIV